MKIIRSRLFRVLVALFILGFILGIFSYFLSDKNNDYLSNYFIMVKTNNTNYILSIFDSIIHNYTYCILIWICGFVFVFSFIIPFIIIFRGISLGFVLCNIFVIFRLKGLIIAFILLFPCILINELVYIFISYYSINISYRTLLIIKDNKSINLKSYFKNYFFQLIIFLIALLFSSLFEIFITSKILGFVV